MERKEVQMNETEKTANVLVASFWSKNEVILFSPYSREETLARMLPEMEAAFGPDGLKDVTLREATSEEIEEIRKMSQTFDTDLPDIPSATLH